MYIYIYICTSCMYYISLSIYVYIYIYIYVSAKRICLVAAGWFDSPRRRVAPRSRIPRTIIY